MSDYAVLREVDLWSAASIIASKYNCRINDIDFEERVIDFDGEDEDVCKCIEELSVIFCGYL